MSLKDEIETICGDESLCYEEKLAHLELLVKKHEALILLGKNHENTITLRDTLGGLPPLYLVIEKHPFDEIMRGVKTEEYRYLSDGNINRMTYRYEGRRYLKPFDRIRLCVGYHKNREEAVVEVTGIETDGTLVTYKLGGIIYYKPK